MEFFGFANLRTDEKRLQQCLSLERLPEFCAGISSLVKQISDQECEVYCLWGHFAIRKGLINGGVRFTMPTCPNALAWTVTTGLPPAPDQVVVHCTIARSEARPGLHRLHRGVRGPVGGRTGGLGRAAPGLRSPRAPGT